MSLSHCVNEESAGHRAVTGPQGSCEWPREAPPGPPSQQCSGSGVCVSCSNLELWTLDFLQALYVCLLPQK